MRRRFAVLCLIVGLAWVAFADGAAARGGLFFHKPRGTPPPGPPRDIEHTHDRAGYPLSVSNHAELSNTPAYDGGYVGGGAAHGGEGRGFDEGTWGWDYSGTHLTRLAAGLGPWDHARHARPQRRAPTNQAAPTSPTRSPAR